MQGLSRLASLSAQDRARVLTRLRGGAPAGTSARLVPRRRRPGEPGMASFLQEQLWFLDQLVGAEPVYNVPFSFRLHGQLHVDALLASIRDVIDRHDVLRSRLVVDNGTLIQAPGAAPQISILDTAGSAPEDNAPEDTAPEDTAAADRRRVAELARTRFDLAAGPLLRVELLRLGPVDHRLVWVAHHTVIDGWSVGVVLDELRAGYRARTVGADTAPRADPGPQYADFARWQRDRLTGSALDALLAHWRGRLSGASFAGVPTDYPRPQVQTFVGGLDRFQLPPRLTSAVRELATRHRVTLFTALLAAYQVLAASHAGAAEAVVGVPIAGRTTPELQTLVGPVSNTVPVRVDVSDDPTFSTVLARVAGGLLDAAAHHEVPLGRLVSTLRADRDISRNPLFGVVFNMDTLPVGADTGELAPGLTLTAGGHPNGTVRMDLELTVEHAPTGRLDARLEYNVDLYSPGTVRRFAGQLQKLLGAVAAAPDRRLSAIGALSAVARQRLDAAAPALTGRSAGQISDWLASAATSLP